MVHPSLPPDQLRRMPLAQVLSTVRSERLPMEKLNYEPALPVVCRVEHGRPDLASDHLYEESRQLGGVIAATLFDAIGRQARAAGLLSDEHLT